MYAALAASASVLLRLTSYVFLRWIPGHPFPPVILGTALLYFSFLHKFRKQTQRQKTEAATKNGQAGSTAASQTEHESPISLVLSLLTGAPRRSGLHTFISSAVNLCLLAMTFDMVYHGPLRFPSNDLAFSRVAYVSENSAKIIVREPRENMFPLKVEYRFVGPVRWTEYFFLRSPSNRPWRTAAEVGPLSNETDFTATVSINDLLPDSQYEYTLSNKNTGGFITAPPVGQFSARKDRGAGDEFTFLHSSCIKARFPYSPLDHPLHVRGLKLLSEWLPSLKAQFMLFLGDFIYIDVPHRFGQTVEHYRQEYRRVYASPDWDSVSFTRSGSRKVALPWLHVLDDHEIANDWDKNTTGLYSAAFDPFQHYHMNGNPGVQQNTSMKSTKTYTSFVQGPASFFMLDTRRYRSDESLPNDAPLEEKTMLGRRQLGELLAWLQAPEPAGVYWKIIVSSVPFTKNWKVGNGDTWGGYLSERELILDLMFDVRAKQGYGIVVLSGDRHEFAATRFVPTEERRQLFPDRWPEDTAVYEYSTGPLSMFSFPFQSYKSTPGEDECIKYIPHGRSKFGAVRISARAAGHEKEKTDATTTAEKGTEKNGEEQIGAKTESGLPAEAREGESGAKPDVSVRRREPDSFLTYQLIVEGADTWSHTIDATVDHRSPSRYTQIISQIPGVNRLVAQEREYGLSEFYHDEV